MSRFAIPECQPAAPSYLELQRTVEIQKAHIAELERDLAALRDLKSGWKPRRRRKAACPNCQAA
jgi:CRISPR/Cas system-associated exonuclease Cas4 (RecB family)